MSSQSPVCPSIAKLIMPLACALRRSFSLPATCCPVGRFVLVRKSSKMAPTFPKNVLKKTQDGTLKSLRTTRGYADRSFPVPFCGHHNANALLATFLTKCDHTITTYSMRLLIILSPLRCHLGTILGSSGSILL